ncbi:hypothetical protein [Sutcliffiella horikoshii]
MVEVRLGNVESGLGNVEGLPEIVEVHMGNVQTADFTISSPK